MKNCTVQETWWGRSKNKWKAILVEANPYFEGPLGRLVREKEGLVKALVPRPAFMCDAKLRFYLNTANHGAADHWGSSLSSNHPDVLKNGRGFIMLETLNVMQLVFEHTIPEDSVILKMDIEGSEWDVLPCLVKSPVVSLIDAIFVEQHPRNLGTVGTTEEELAVAIQTLKDKGVGMPAYGSPW